MRYLFDGDFDLLEHILEEKLDDYNNIVIYEEPVLIEETIQDVIKNGTYYRVNHSETIVINNKEWKLREMIPVIANSVDYHVIGVSEDPQDSDIEYFAVPCNWSPRYGSPNLSSETAEEEP